MSGTGFRNGTGHYFRDEPGVICIDVRAAEVSVSCCGVNLAGASCFFSEGCRGRVLILDRAWRCGDQFWTRLAFDKGGEPIVGGDGL
jgi:hypothetical protein